MTKLSRSADGFFVDLIQPGMKVRFNRVFGGAPLEVYQTDNPVKPISVISQPSGEGFQVVWDTGQDGTQASGTGLDSNPLDPSGYYTREEAFLPDAAGHEALYQVGGPAPYFWISVDKEDDCVPSDPRGDHRWSIRYHDILNLGPSAYVGYGVPIWFAGTAQVSSGIILMGDEIVQTYNPSAPWWDTAARVENGNVAFKVSLSLKNAGNDALGGVVFANDANLTDLSDINTIYNAPGYILLANKYGGVAVHKNGFPIPIPVNQQATALKLNSDEGLILEARVNGNVFDIYVDNSYRTSVAREVFGPYNGLFASGVSGKIKFQHRLFYDMGTAFSAQYRSTKRNTLLQTLSVLRVMPPYTAPFYRTNLPVAWIDPALREVSWCLYKDGNQIDNPGMIEFEDSKVFYAGKANGTAGLYCKVHGWSGGGAAHAGIGPAYIALNTMSFGANLVPEEGSHFSITSEWAPKVRSDML